MTASLRSRVLVTAVLGVIALYFLLPVYWLVVASTKSTGDLFGSSGLWFADVRFVENIANVFSYDNRLQVAEHAYRSTLVDLRARRADLEPVLARHGLALDAAVLDDESRTLRAGLGPAPAPRTAATERLRAALDELETLVAPAPRSRRPQRVHS